MVYGEDDLDASPAWLQRVARERLGTEAHGLPGGHSPFLARPAALADLLEKLTADT
jgi:pimeloyl-ACP methyl ester carboxylesterase